MDRLLWAKVCAYLAERRIRSRQMAMMLYAMITEEVSYAEALAAFADWAGDAPERVQAANCGALLRAAIEQHPERLLEEAARGGVLRAD